MPSEFSYSYQDESKRIAAWAKHYEAKGCSSTKAQYVATKKVHKSRTWPPLIKVA